MSYNNKFLIEVAKLNPDIDFLSKVSFTSLDWDYILSQSRFHSILPMLYYHCANLECIPEYYKDLLQSNYVVAESRGRLMTNEYKTVLKRLNEEGVKAILLKGVYLGTRVYKNVALRPFGDMDILIEKENSEKVFKVLLELGYSQSEIDPNSGEQIPLGEDRLQGYEQELQHFGEFFKKNESNLLNNGFYIDVHHRLSTIFDNFSYNVNEIIDRSVQDYLDDIPIFRLSNEDFLTHLCTHLYWHTQSLRDILDGNDARLLAYSDIRSFVQTHEIDWELLFHRAQKTNIDGALHYTLYHAHLLFGDVIPDDLYKSWNVEYLDEISNSIYDRWITRDNSIKIGEWKQDFMTRLFNLDRSSIALKSFYEDYLEPILHRGGVLKVVEFGDPNR